MPTRETELDQVLRPLAGADLYRRNIFRITGLPVDATPTQVRRRREELELAAELGVAPPVADGTPADADAIRGAFETMRDPVARLVHEMLWEWPAGPEADGSAIDEHNHAVRVHRSALEGEGLDHEWSEGLARWADVLVHDDVWRWAKERVREIDDPRLTTGTVRRLRDRLPEHIVSVSAALAARAAADDDLVTARRMIDRVTKSTFDADLVRRELRAAARPAEDRVTTALDNAASAVTGDLSGAIRAAETLLERTRTPLRVIDVLVGADNAVSMALHDEVAAAVNRNVVAYYNANSDQGHWTDLLRRARELAREQATRDMIDTNVNAARRHPGVEYVMKLVAEGRVDYAQAHLRAVRRHSKNPDEHADVANLLATKNVPLLAPLKGSPRWGGLFGIGTMFYGRRPLGPEPGMFARTKFFTVLFVPIFPLGAYLCQDTSVFGRVPQSMPVVWWGRLMSIVVPMLLANFFIGGSFTLVVAVVMVAFLVLRLGFREIRLARWVARSGPRWED